MPTHTFMIIISFKLHCG